MDSASERTSSTTFVEKIDRLIEAIDANTKVMRDLRVALLESDGQDSEDSIPTYLDGSFK